VVVREPCAACGGTGLRGEQLLRLGERLTFVQVVTLDGKPCWSCWGLGYVQRGRGKVSR
jgi:hypothetical protein